jgi:hypothetical protein
MMEFSNLIANDGWSPDLVRELEANRNNGRVGSQLVSETERVRVWHLTIPPGGRFGFHCHVLDYFWTALMAEWLTSATIRVIRSIYGLQLVRRPGMTLKIPGRAPCSL